MTEEKRRKRFFQFLAGDASLYGLLSSPAGGVPPSRVIRPLPGDLSAPFSALAMHPSMVDALHTPLGGMRPHTHCPLLGRCCGRVQ